MNLLIYMKKKTVWDPLKFKAFSLNMLLLLLICTKTKFSYKYSSFYVTLRNIYKFGTNKKVTREAIEKEELGIIEILKKLCLKLFPMKFSSFSMGSRARSKEIDGHPVSWGFYEFKYIGQ